LLPLESRPRVRSLLRRLHDPKYQTLRDDDHAQTRAMRVVVVILALVS
jgi:hypothetical protein